MRQPLKRLNYRDKQKRILGVWDSNILPVSLGGLLILVEELQIQRIILGVDFADICVIGHEKRGGVCNKSSLISVLTNMDGIDKCYLTNSVEDLRKSLKLSPCITWPVIGKRGIANHLYESTLFIQEFYRKKGFIPNLYCKIDSVRRAMNFIKRHCAGLVPVVVHLKNNPKRRHCSNADFDAWYNFLNNCHKRYASTFIIIGDEVVPGQIRGLPNVVMSRNYGGDLSLDLSLIQLSSIFIGMASGPCNMAIFSDIPYTIYKDPDHHTKEMRKELGNSDRFSFAAPLQRILRVCQTGKSLLSEFDYLYNHTDQRKWKERFEKSTKKEIKHERQIAQR